MPSGRSEYKLLTTGRTYQFPIPEKLQGDWVQAFVAMISGIIYVDKRYLWLVYGCLENDRPTIPETTLPNACTHSP